LDLLVGLGEVRPLLVGSDLDVKFVKVGGCFSELGLDVASLLVG